MRISREGAEAPSARRLATRARLLDAASEIFAEEGLQGAAVEAICGRAGFSRGAFYSNFETKEQLFLELLGREFERRAAHLEAQANAIEPALRERGPHFTPSEAAAYIADFFAPECDATTWYVLETEFLLLTLRDASIAPGFHEFWERFYESIAGAIERVVASAGRRFVLPVERAVPLLGGVYERALRASALATDEASGALDELSDRLAEVLFALTEPLPGSSPA